MRWIIRWSLQFRYVVLGVAAVMTLYGITQLGSMPVDVLPEFAPPYVEIQTESLGLSAGEVEQLITVPMEQDLLSGVPWVETVRSESVPGLSSIVLVFQPGTDIYQARQMVAERMTQAVALPHVSKPPTMLQPLSATSRVMIVGLSSKSLSPIQMGVLARWTIVPRLIGVPGVANVAVWGRQDRQLQVQVDPQRLAAQNVSLFSVLETTGNALWVSTLSFVEASTPGTGGFIDTPNQRLGIRHVSPIITPDGLAQIPISDKKKSDGTPLRLSDVANVVEDHQPLIGDAVVDSGSGLLLVIEKFPGASALDVTRRVEAALEQMQPGLPGLAVNSAVYRPATFIENALSNFALAMLLGGALAVLALGVFYRDWRVTLISAVAIPLSLVAAGVALYLRGATMNVMLLAGLLIAVGSVVDDAIIGAQNVARRLCEHRGRRRDGSTATIILDASHEVRQPILFATLITVLVVVPIFFVEGISGAFFQPAAISYGLAVLASLVVALTVTPALCLLLLKDAPSEPRESLFVRQLHWVFDPLLTRGIRRPHLAVVTLAGLALLGLATLPFLGQSLVPSFKERDLLIHLSGPPGMSQPETSRITGRVAAELRSVPGIRDVGAHIGRAVLGDQVVGVNSAELWVNLDPSVDYDKTVAAVQRVVSGYPGLKHDVQSYLGETTRAVVAKPQDSLIIRVYGDTDEILRSEAEKVRKSVADIDGIVATRIDFPIQELTLETEVNIAAAQANGLKPGDVRRAAATLLSGIQVGSLFEEQKIFDVVVWSTPETRHSLSSVRDLLIDTPDGRQVRLGDVAQVRIVPTANVIRHESDKRYFDVVADVRGRDLGAVATTVKIRLHQGQFPLEYHAEVLSDYPSMQAAQARLVGVVVAVLVGILLLLQAAFNSWRLAFLIVLTLLSALVGGLLAAFAVGGVISLGSLVGLLGVFGIAARNGMLMISHFQHLAREEGEPFGVELALRGTRERLAPILMTALATGLALVPALFLGDRPGLEIVRPMAVVVLGGLITSTLLNLLIVPTLYVSLAVSRARDLEQASVNGVAQPAAKGALVDVPEMAPGT